MSSTKIEPKVINLSSLELDNGTIELLKKGPKFTPTPKRDRKILKEDVYKFCRSLRLKEYFFGLNDEENTTKLDKSETKVSLRRKGTGIPL